MKASKREIRKPRPAPLAATSPALADRRAAWLPLVLALAVMLAVVWAYAPAAYGPFLFDDNGLVYSVPTFSRQFVVWIHELRPVLMASYWINAQLSGTDPHSYHVLNVIVHLAAGVLIFLIVRRLLEWSGSATNTRTLLSGFAAAVFLLHPVQSEAVAYVAGRSEALSDALMLAAYAIFLYRRSTAISWLVTAFITLMFVAALLAKEQTIALPALLLLTDIWWNPGFSLQGVRRNWRLYGVIALGAGYGLYRFWPNITAATTAGFGLKDLPWYQYLFTQFRALFVYIWQFLFPVNLTADWDFPISRNIVDHGAIAGLLALLVLAGAAWRYRRQYRLASFGFFVYLLVMAPTSSILPIRDPVAERRLYAAMLGLLLIVVDLLTRVKPVHRKLAAVACSVALLALAAATRARAAVWSGPRFLWEDTVAKSPGKARVHFQLGSTYCGPECGGALQDQDAPRYDLAIAEYARASQLEKPSYELLVDWAAAYDSLNQPDKALAKLREAAALDGTAHVYSQIARVYAKQQRWSEALDALATAEKLNPNFAPTYAYRGLVHLATQQPAAAVQDFQRALTLDGNLQAARDGLARAQGMLGAGQ
jgi:tetratricopeptide (TPR) repeat protein